MREAKARWFGYNLRPSKVVKESMLDLTQEEAMNIVGKLYPANIDEQAIRVAKAYIIWEVANQTDG